MISQIVSALPRDNSTGFAYERVIDDICDLNWVNLSQEDLIGVAWVYFLSQYSSASALKSLASSILTITDCCNSIMANGTRIIFRHGQALPRLEKR